MVARRDNDFSAQFAAAMAELNDDDNTDPQMAAAKRRLHAGIPALLDPDLAPKRAAAKRRRRIITVTAIGVPAALAIGGVASIWITGALLGAAAEPTPQPQPQITLLVTPSPTITPSPSPSPTPRPSPSPSPEPAPAPTETTPPATNGGNSGGSSGSSGSSGGGNAPAPEPAPKPAPAPFVDELSFTAASGAGYIDVVTNVHTTGAMSVTVTATAGGISTTLGTATVDGSQIFTGRIEGLEGAQQYTLTVTAGGLSTSKTVNVL